MGQEVPGTTRAKLVEDGVEHLTQVGFARPAAAGRRGQQRPENLPLDIGQIGVVEASGLGRGGAWRSWGLAGAGAHDGRFQRWSSRGPSVVVEPHETEKISFLSGLFKFPNALLARLCTNPGSG